MPLEEDTHSTIDIFVGRLFTLRVKFELLVWLRYRASLKVEFHTITMKVHWVCRSR